MPEQISEEMEALLVHRMESEIMSLGEFVEESGVSRSVVAAVIGKHLIMHGAVMIGASVQFDVDNSVQLGEECLGLCREKIREKIDALQGRN